MADTFQPPANLKDFNRSARGQELSDLWHQRMNSLVNRNIASRPAFYNTLTPPSDEQPAPANPEWTGLPRTIKRLVPQSIAAAARLVDNAIPMGNPDPMEGNFTPPFFDAAGAAFPGQAYRPQDEYLEWVTRRAPDGTVTEVVFTCEGPGLGVNWIYINYETTNRISFNYGDERRYLGRGLFNSGPGWSRMLSWIPEKDNDGVNWEILSFEFDEGEQA